ncbi:hypothetical protein WMF45_30915 [Sorangium sp. So ce448]|uniref:hypothetical protein n=1 Tax=Sorangium sp. So ce448 TaxID=3133314 RepID=UPI003F620523
MAITRKVYVISDLHLGGRPATAQDRGFRMMKHPDELAAFIRGLPAKRTATTAVELVINGDFVDFLAHDHGGAKPWKAFAYEKGEALRAFEAIAGGADKPVFEALAELTKTCRLTVMLGNHDLELSLPEVREALLKKLGDAPSANVRFQYDGEALEVGDALIEHGNAHDPSNAVDFNGLRYLRAIRSRGHLDPDMQRRAFRAPPGSELVASVMNPLKERYAFIDLLKPESEALFSLLVAIEPDARGELDKLAKLIRGVAQNLIPKPGFPVHLANVSASAAEAMAKEAAEEGALDALMAKAVPPGAAVPAAAAPHAGVTLTDVSFASWMDSKIGFWRSFVERGEASLPERLPALRRAFRALEGDPTWRTDVESGKRYQDAACELARSSGNRRGYRFVVFGHTHHAKRQDLPNEGAVYLNSGTWANLLRFPVLPDDDVGALATILKFAEDVKANNFDTEDGTIDGPMHGADNRLRQIFHPTYVRLDVRDDDKVDDGKLGVYDWKADKLE